MANDNNVHETLADIVAEMRGMGNYQQYSGDHARALADRIEAAAAREREAIIAEAMPVGNAAAMREALQSCLDTICRIVWIDDPEYDEDGHYLGANYAAVSRDKARAALAALPRNCDRFATVKEAAMAFARERPDTPQPCSDFTFSVWLLAKVTEEGVKVE